MLFLILAWPGLARASAPLGSFDLATPERVAGWAYDPDYANSINIHVYVDGVFYRNITANKYRPDLTSWHGGYIAFDSPIMTGCGTHTVSIYAIGVDATGQPNGENPGIWWSPKSVTRTCPAGGAPVGFLDVGQSNWLAGWAYDPDYSGPIDVHVYVDGAFYTTIRAASYRGDVGYHAFDYREGFIPAPPPGGVSWIPHGGLALGAGNHRVELYAVGVDGAGNPDGGLTLLANTPSAIAGHPNDVLVLSDDESIRVIVSRQFGGAITKIHDSAQPQSNLIDGDQVGAMFQSVFWLLPYRAPSPGCPDRADFRYDNPMQAGFYADGWIGNPIGRIGSAGGADPNEFLAYENDMRTVHFKTRLMRWDFCSVGYTDESNRFSWETDFYLEQWVRFDPTHTRTLKIRNVLTYVGPSGYVTASSDMNSRQLPIMFGQELDRLNYWNGSAREEIACDGDPTVVNPPASWIALVAAGNDGVRRGVGFVEKPTLQTTNGGPKFQCHYVAADLQGKRVTPVLTNLPALETIGTTGATRLADAYRFGTGATFEWFTFYPLGTFDAIRGAAEAITGSWGTYAIP